MVKSKYSFLRPLIFSTALIVIESFVHFLLTLIIRLSNYTWSQTLEVSKYTGTSQFENIFYGVLTILFLRFLFELPARIMIEYAGIKNIFFKALIYILIVVALSVSYGLRLGFSFDMDTFMDTQSGWIFHLPMSVLIVWVILIISNLIKHK